MSRPALLASAGYQSLLKAVERDEQRSPGFHDYRAKLEWVLVTAEHYSEKTGLPAEQILNAWEDQRSYWYMNFYQAANQPPITDESVRIFQTTEELVESVGRAGFRCPKCEGVSSNPCECSLEGCDWKVYGLFGHLGKGISVFVVSAARVSKLFYPIAWEGDCSTPTVD